MATINKATQRRDENDWKQSDYEMVGIALQMCLTTDAYNRLVADWESKYKHSPNEYPFWKYCLDNIQVSYRPKTVVPGYIKVSTKKAKPRKDKTAEAAKERLRTLILLMLRSDDPKRYYAQINELRQLSNMNFDTYKTYYEKLQSEEYQHNKLCNTHVTANNSIGMGPW